MTYEVLIGDKTYRVELRDGAVCVDGKDYPVDARLTERDVLSLLLDGKSYEVKRAVSAIAGQHIVVRGDSFAVEVRDPRAFRTRRAAGEAQGPSKLLSPMPGKVVRILAPAGTQVEAGQGVIVVEAMKMQNELKSPKAGTVRKITAAEGAAVNAGEVLAIVE